LRRTTTRWIALAVVTAAALTGCSDDDNGSGGGSDEPAVIEITFEDGEVSPNGDRVEVEAGQPIDLEVTADEPGEIHIHSDPEQQFEYVEGENKFEIQFDRPGIVVVESHDLDKVIVQLEVK
jgi:hypothetical protein